MKLTAAAVSQLQLVQPLESKPYLRVSVISGGSTGFMYDMKFGERLDVDNDFLDNSFPVAVVVDKRSSLFLEGATIDWQTSEDGKQGFKFDNPNAVK